MAIPKSFYQQRKQEAINVWVKMFTLWKGGMTPRDIAKKFINEQTGKPYTREHVYHVLKVMKEKPAEELQNIINSQE